MRVGYDVHQLARLEPAGLCEHVHKHGVLADVPVVGREHVLAALVEYGVERVARDVEGHRVRAGVERHLVQILKVVEAGEYAAGGAVVLEVVQHAVDLVEFALGILVLHAELIAVGLADGAVLVRPGVPDAAAQLMDVVGLLLPDPQQLVHRAFPEGAAYGEYGELLGEIVTVDYAKALDRVGALAVLPARADVQLRVPEAVVEDITAVLYEQLVRAAHGFTSVCHILYNYNILAL